MRKQSTYVVPCTFHYRNIVSSAQTKARRKSKWSEFSRTIKQFEGEKGRRKYYLQHPELLLCMEIYVSLHFFTQYICFEIFEYIAVERTTSVPRPIYESKFFCDDCCFIQGNRRRIYSAGRILACFTLGFYYFTRSWYCFCSYPLYFCWSWITYPAYCINPWRCGSCLLLCSDEKRTFDSNSCETQGPPFMEEGSNHCMFYTKSLDVFSMHSVPKIQWMTD
jgi:hypothetical protein